MVYRDEGQAGENKENKALRRTKDKSQIKASSVLVFWK